VPRLQGQLNPLRRLVRRARLRPRAGCAATVGAYLASLAETHAPATVRRLPAIGKVHRFNDLP